MKPRNKRINRTCLAALLSLGAVLPLYAQNIEEARQLVLEGDYAKAARMLDNLSANDPKIKGNALYNYLCGVCQIEQGDYNDARKSLETAKSKGYGAANLYLGRLAFLDYDFERATELYGEYKRHRDKLGQVYGEDIDELERQLESAENALGRVEKITVLDSIAVPADRFFEYYRLSRSAGRLLPPEEMPIDGHQDGAIVAFMNEKNDFMMWGEPDSVGNVRIVESNRLTDGTWQEPTPTPSFLNRGGYADYPFMMPDGVTMYYASDGNDSMGGYDIFVVSRDGQTGEYLQPQNIGMPFNSPHDDFMLAIDEENGLGWWATDRNLLGDKLTIYVYKVNDTRVNLSEDDGDILSRARLADYRSTQSPADREWYAETVDRLEAEEKLNDADRAEFYLPKGDGTYYKFFKDLKNDKARSAMKKYLMSRASLDKEEDRLEKLRKRYAVNHADNVKQQIIQFEKEVEGLRAETKKLKGEVYRLEQQR